jgi:circadian clock protein KaiC
MRAVPLAAPLQKMASGIDGFDDITAGGLPMGRTTLLMGGPGSGKTVLAVQILVGAAIQHRIPGVFVAFEEDALRVAANAEAFGWKIGANDSKRLLFLDARTRSGVIKTGEFDLEGMLGVVAAAAKKMEAGIVVFDAIDVLLCLLDNPAAESRELHRIHEWLALHELTGVITTKVEGDNPSTAQRYGFMPFMADCALLLTQRVVERVTVRAMRVVKYRGSAHVLNEVPFVIRPHGVDVGSSNGLHPEPQPFEDRVSTGIADLDAMLDGGLYRGTNLLLTGSSGTGKSLLAGAFIEAACRRRERAMFISFDQSSRDIVRDLASVGIDILPHLMSGLLGMEALRTEAASSEEHFMHIKRLILDHQPRSVAIDPLSAIARVGGGAAARAVAGRLIYLCRNAGITVLFTSLGEGTDPILETTPLHVSSIADSWVHLSYSLQGAERTRTISVIKSRGSNHSSQVREVIVDREGISLMKSNNGAGSGAPAGRLRNEKERLLQGAVERKHQGMELRRRKLDLLTAMHTLEADAARSELRICGEELDLLKHAMSPPVTAANASSAQIPAQAGAKAGTDADADAKLDERKEANK